MKTAFAIPFCYLVTAMLSIVVTTDALASTIIHGGSGESALVKKGDEGANDSIVINTPNAQGVSINRYAQFSVDAPLNLISLGSGDTRFAADVIVIQAPNIRIKDQITVIGPKADVIFVGTGSGAALTCEPCDMRQTLRVVLAAAKPVTLSRGEVATLSTQAGSHIRYSAINTPGAIALELVSDKLETAADALISTMESAAKHANGGYVSDENGSLVMGGGAVNFSLGHLTWNFTNQSIQAFDGQARSGDSRHVTGHIRSTVVSINTAHELYVNAVIDTRSDLLSSHRYQNKVIANEEQVHFSTLYGKHPVRVYGNVDTEGQMTVRSNGDVYLYRSGFTAPVLRAGTLRTIARKNIDTRATVVAESIQMAGQSILNKKMLQGFSSIELFAEGNITNQGEVTADKVLIESESGTFLNGFRGGIGTQALKLNVQHYQTSNPSQRGLAFDPSVNKNATYKSIQQAASVTAQDLHIKVKNLENINPYYAKDGDNDGLVDLDTRYFDQVRLSAEKDLLVNASGYIVNASAVIEQNDPSGHLRMAANIFVNDRYLVYSPLAHYNANDYHWSAVITSNTITTETAVYSPPGRIVFFGQSYIGGAKGIVNHASYIEGFDGAELYTPLNVSDIGIQHQQIGQTTQVDFAADAVCLGDRRQRTLGSSDRRERSLCDGLNQFDQRIVAEDLHSMDSLLFIQGNAVGDKAKLQVMTVKPFEYYQMQAIKRQQEAIFASKFQRNSTNRRYEHEIQNNTVVMRAYETREVENVEYFNCLQDGQPVIPREPSIDNDNIKCDSKVTVSNVERRVGTDQSLSRYILMQQYYNHLRESQEKFIQRIQ